MFISTASYYYRQYYTLQYVSVSFKWEQWPLCSDLRLGLKDRTTLVYSKGTYSTTANLGFVPKPFYTLYITCSSPLIVPHCHLPKNINFAGTPALLWIKGAYRSPLRSYYNSFAAYKDTVSLSGTKDTSLNRRSNCDSKKAQLRNSYYHLQKLLC